MYAVRHDADDLTLDRPPTTLGSHPMEIMFRRQLPTLVCTNRRDRSEERGKEKQQQSSPGPFLRDSKRVCRSKMIQISVSHSEQIHLARAENRNGDTSLLLYLCIINGLLFSSRSSSAHLSTRRAPPTQSRLVLFLEIIRCLLGLHRLIARPTTPCSQAN